MATLRPSLCLLAQASGLHLSSLSLAALALCALGKECPWPPCGQAFALRLRLAAFTSAALASRLWPCAPWAMTALGYPTRPSLCLFGSSLRPHLSSLSLAALALSALGKECPWPPCAAMCLPLATLRLWPRDIRGPSLPLRPWPDCLGLSLAGLSLTALALTPWVRSALGYLAALALRPQPALAALAL